MKWACKTCLRTEEAPSFGQHSDPDYNGPFCGHCRSYMSVVAPNDPVQDSEEFMVFDNSDTAREVTQFPAKPRPEPPRRTKYLIAKSIAESDLGWTGFLLLTPLVFAAFLVIVAFAYWIAFSPQEMCSRCGYDRSRCGTWRGPTWTGPAEKETQ